MDIGTEHLILPATVLAVVLSGIGVIYVFRAMKLLGFPKFWRTQGFGFITGMITTGIMILLYFLNLLRDWGWVLILFACVIGPFIMYVTLKLKRKLHG